MRRYSYDEVVHLAHDDIRQYKDRGVPEDGVRYLLRRWLTDISHIGLCNVEDADEIGRDLEEDNAYS